MAPEPPSLVVADTDAWRTWLEANGSSSAGVWLVLAKQGTTDPTSLTYDQALDEALAHGWIDGQLRGIDDRTFARRFRDEVGTTPHAWITSQRVLRAEEMLEATDHPVERIAALVGFGNAATLRHHFTRARGLSPQDYRRTFGRQESAGMMAV